MAEIVIAETADYRIVRNTSPAGFTDTIEFNPGTQGANQATLEDLARQALVTNRTYVAIASPTAAQTTVQVKALSRQMNGLIRLLLGQLDGTD